MVISAEAVASPPRNAMTAPTEHPSDILHHCTLTVGSLGCGSYSSDHLRPRLLIRVFAVRFYLAIS